jgi:amino acid permease
MSAQPESLSYAEKGEKSPPFESAGSGDPTYDVVVEDYGQGKLHRNLQGRHMQMIAM